MRIVQHEDTLDQVVSVLAHQAKGRRFETSWGLRTHAVHHISRIWLAECVRFLSPDGCAHTTPMAKLQRLKRFKCSRSPCVLRHSTSIIFLFSRPLQFSILDVNIPNKKYSMPVRPRVASPRISAWLRYHCLREYYGLTRANTLRHYIRQFHTKRLIALQGHTWVSLKHRVWLLLDIYNFVYNQMLY
jgi:hypothetical protein